MKPHKHAESSAHKYGGQVNDYIDIHQYMDSTKSAVPDVRHRAILHSAFGCYIIEDIFGITRTNSSGKDYSVRDIAEDHIIEDLGFIPSMDKWLQAMELQDWMGGRKFTKKKIFEFND